MRIERFEDLQCWQRAQELAVMIYEHFRDLKDFSFKDQICRAAVSVSNNVAEGFDRGSNKDFLKFLYIARASNSEVKSMIYLAQKLNYTNQENFNKIINKCSEVGKTTNGFISYLIKTTQTNQPTNRPTN
jgi:four helix bundle protein